MALLGIPASQGRAKTQVLAAPARSLRVPITVYEDAGVGRTRDAVRTGVPLPRSADVRDVRSLRLEDETGAGVPVQVRALSRWGAPVTETSAPLRWVLADFHATVPGNGSRNFVLHTSRDPRKSDPPALAREEGGVIRAGSGSTALSFSVAQPGPLRVIARAPGKSVSVAGRATSVEIEENGPLRACIAVRGRLDGGYEEVRGRRPLEWTMRWHVSADSPLVRVQVTIENPDRPHVKPFNEVGDPVGKRFGRLALELATPSTPERVAIVQEADGYEARRGNRVAEKGTRAPGWLSSGGWVLGMHAFAENHPKALVAGGGTLALEIFPADSEPVFFGGARAKTHEVWIRLPAGAASPEEAAALAMHPLRAAVPPAWLQETRALGPLSVEDVKRWPGLEATLDRIVATDLAPRKGTIFDERRASKTTGWLDYGDSLRAARNGQRRFGNGEFDFGWVLLRQYLREPDHDRVWLEQAEAVLRHVMDIDVLHTDDDASWANHGVRKHDGGGFARHSRGPDFSHFWVRGLLAFHVTTGDARAKDVAVGELGSWIRNREDPERPGWLVHADELRDVGWVLIALADLFEATGEEAWLDLSHRVARTMVLPGVAADGTMRDAPFLRRRESFAPWQQAYIADGLGRLCLLLRERGEKDADLEAALRRMLEFLAGPAWIEEPQELYGETYSRMVAYSVDRSGTLDAGEASMSQALADPFVWGWMLFGEARYRAAALEANRHTFPRGAKTYFHPSVSTPAKNAAVRTYFGEAARWLEQTSSAPQAASATPIPAE